MQLFVFFLFIFLFFFKGPREQMLDILHFEQVVLFAAQLSFI